MNTSEMLDAEVVRASLLVKHLMTIEKADMMILSDTDEMAQAWTAWEAAVAALVKALEGED